jgi:hypothetical protein
MDEQIVIQKRRFWMVASFFGIVASLYLLAGTANQIKTYGTIAPVPASNTISVSGDGESYVKPDLATFSFTITQNAKAVGDAQSAATGKINTTIEVLKQAGVAEKDIKTIGYDVYPKFDYQQVPCVSGYCPQANQKIVGYEVSQSVEVKVRDLTKAGDLLTLVGQNSPSNISGLTFTVDNPDDINRQARELAITKAKAKAEQLANDLGVRLVRIVSYSESGNNPIYYAKASVGGGVMAADAVAPSIPTGENKITSNVNIVYEIR